MLRITTLLAFLSASAASAATISLDSVTNEVTVRGNLTWEHVIRGDIGGPNPNPGEEFIRRRVTSYELIFPAGPTPFGDGFTPPARNSTEEFGRARVTIGNPQLDSGGDTFVTDVATFDLTDVPDDRLPSNTGRNGVVTEDFFFRFPVEGGSLFPDREGDRRWSFSMTFDPTFSQVLAVAGVMDIRTPIIGNVETSSRDLYNGIDTEGLPIFVGDVTSDPGGPPPVDPDPAAPAPIPLPATVWALIAALGGLGLFRRHARRQ